MAFIAYKRPKDGGAGDQDSSSWEPEVLVLRINLDMKARSASAKELARCPFDYVPSMMVLSGPRLFVANQANSSSIEEDEDTALRLFSWPERRYVPLPEMLPSVYLNAYPDYFLSLGIINESTIALQILTYTPSRAVDDDDDGGDGKEYTHLSDTDHFLIATIGLPSPPSPGLHFLPRDAMIHHEYNGPNVNDVVIWICDKVAHLEGEIDSHAWTVFEITLDFAQLFQFQFQRRKGDHSVGGGGDETEADLFRYNKSEKPNTERIGTISHGGGGGGRDKLLHIGFPIQQEPLTTLNPPPPPAVALPPPPPPLKFDLVQKRITNFPFFRLLRSLGKGFRVARLEMMPDLSSPGSSRSTIYPIIYDTRTCPQFDTSTLVAWSPLVPSDVTVSLQSSISVDDEQEHEQADVDLSPESRLYLFDGVEATGIFVFVLNDGDVCVLRYGHA
ncbi:hypothetical protein FRC20_007214 [Serendipita sp. 405]|nr:hypothetical protein FRC15_005913 [Serendipita sp. 397]KAG8768793.1 hypothetical protein FRC16_006909 [Serendipita sp. 398]KAG8835648.1 hypothetical protein FRC20_007214 [Serendipita sp. 405]